MSDNRPNGMRSNAENILRATLGEAVEYDKPNSPVEYYLMQLKDMIERLATADNIVDNLYNRLKNCPVNTTPVYGNQPIFTCPQNMNSGCGCGSF